MSTKLLTAITLPADPITAMEAATKQYVDAAGGGTTILSGTATPTNAVGEVGDYYLDTNDNILYGPKAPIAQNLLTANQASIETDTTGFTALSGTTLARSTSWSAHGSASLQATAGGGTYANLFSTDFVPATAGLTYTAQFVARVAGAGKQVYISFVWYNSSFAAVGSGDSGTITADTTGVLCMDSKVAPGGTAYFKLFAVTGGTGGVAGDIIFFDKLGFSPGTSTAWDLPGGNAWPVAISGGPEEVTIQTTQPGTNIDLWVDTDDDTGTGGGGGGLDQATADTLYVNIDGDTMAGDLNIDDYRLNMHYVSGSTVDAYLNTGWNEPVGPSTILFSSHTLILGTDLEIFLAASHTAAGGSFGATNFINLYRYAAIDEANEIRFTTGSDLRWVIGPEQNSEHFIFNNSWLESIPLKIDAATDEVTVSRNPTSDKGVATKQWSMATAFLLAGM